MDGLIWCPCCGYEAVLETMQVRKGWEADAHCLDCGLSLHTITYGTEGEAVTAAELAWNQRVGTGRKKVRPIDAKTLSDEISGLKIFLAGESLFTLEIKETVLRTIDEQATISDVQFTNEPLTLGELRKMNAEPVWVTDTCSPECSGWHLVCVSGENDYLIDRYGWQIPLSCLGEWRIVHRSKP